jgi:hypothetical protein
MIPTVEGIIAKRGGRNCANLQNGMYVDCPTGGAERTLDPFTFGCLFCRLNEFSG